MILVFCILAALFIGSVISYLMLSKDNEDLEQTINHLVYEKNELDRRVKILEQREMAHRPFQHEIIYKPEDVKSPKYGGF